MVHNTTEAAHFDTKLDVDRKRDKNHTVKWQFGKRVRGPCDARKDGTTKIRPAKVSYQVLTGAPTYTKSGSFARAVAKHVRRHPGFKDELEDESDHEGGEILYSGETESGVRSETLFGTPPEGERVLLEAVSQAEKRFENKQTEKLVKEEYEVVVDDEDDTPATVDEDDFELV